MSKFQMDPKGITKFTSAQRDINDLAEAYGDYRRCVGGRGVHRQYCCTHCGSDDPSTECFAPDPAQKQWLVKKQDGWVRKPYDGCGKK